MQVCFLHTLFLEYATETRGNKCKAVFYRYKQIGMRSLELFWPFSILAKNLGHVLALSLSYVPRTISTEKKIFHECFGFNFFPAKRRDMDELRKHAH